MTRKSPARPFRAGFTIIELLVVLAVLALLVALLLPALSKARETAVRVQCASNLRQQGMTWHIYATQNKDVLPYNRRNDFGKNTIVGSIKTQLFQLGSGPEIFLCPISTRPAGP